MLNLIADWKWLTTHLIIVALAGTLVVGSIYGVLHIQAKDAERHAQEFAQLADSMNKANAAFQASTEAQIKTLAAANQQLALEVGTLTQVLARRQAAEQSLPKKNANLSVIEAARSLQGSADGDNVVLDLHVARDLVTQVQLVPMLEQDKADLGKSNELLAAEVANGEQALDLERKAHASDNSANGATIKARDAEVSALKKNLRKSKMKYFIIGYVAGFITRVATVK